MLTYIHSKSLCPAAVYPTLEFLIRTVEVRTWFDGGASAKTDQDPQSSVNPAPHVHGCVGLMRV